MTGKEQCDTNVKTLAKILWETNNLLDENKGSEDEAYMAIACALADIDVMKELFAKAIKFLNVIKKQEK